jgi:acyl carrier protein
MTVTADAPIAFLRDDPNIEAALDADTPLFSEGVLDSVAMLNIIGFLEDKGGIDVRPADVTLDNSDTVARIVAYAATA